MFGEVLFGTKTIVGCLLASNCVPALSTASSHVVVAVLTSRPGSLLLRRVNQRAPGVRKISFFVSFVLIGSFVHDRVSGIVCTFLGNECSMS